MALRANQPSRKGKKSWRTNIDSTDIETGLDDFHAQQILLGEAIPTMSAKNQLFYHDNTPSINTPKSISWVDSMLVSASKVEKTVGKRAKITTKEVQGKKVSKNMHQTITGLGDRKKSQGMGVGTLNNLKSMNRDSKKRVLTLAKGGFDLWNESSSLPLELIPKPVLGKRFTTVVKPTIENTRPKNVAIVELPHQGISYNPLHSSHVEAMIIAAKPEFVKVDAMLKIQNEMTYPAELDALECTELVDLSDDEEDVVGENAVVDEASKKLLVAKRKSKAARNRMEKEIEKVRQSDRKKAQKVLLQQITQLKQISKDLNIEQKTQLDLLKEKKKVHGLFANNLPKKLTRYNFTPQPYAIKLLSEISAGATLRNLKPEGNMFVDRFKSLQQRQIIETRMPVKRKRKLRVYEVDSHDYKRFR